MSPSRYSEDEITIIKELANAADKEIIASLGLPLRADGKVLCSCPIHGGDNPRGFSYHPFKKIWQCWTHHCHDQYSPSIIGLVQGVKKISFWEALDYVQEFVTNNGDIKIDDIKRNQFIASKNAKENIPPIEIDHIKFPIDNVSPYFLTRNLKQSTLKDFNAWDENNYGNDMYKRACIPLYDDSDHLVGITGRATTSGFLPKWRNYPENLPKNKLLFGLNKAKESIKNTGIVNIVEGPLDLLKLYEADIKNTVSPLGKSISKDQIKLLLKYHVQTVIIWLDPDDAGIEGSIKIENNCQLYFNTINVTRFLPSDPNEMSIEQIKEIYNKYAN